MAGNALPTQTGNQVIRERRPTLGANQRAAHTKLLSDIDLGVRARHAVPLRLTHAGGTPLARVVSPCERSLVSQCPKNCCRSARKLRYSGSESRNKTIGSPDSIYAREVAAPMWREISRAGW